MPVRTAAPTLSLLLATALLLTACASPSFDSDDPEDEGGPPRAQLFMSPSGQPFRAAPGQPYPSIAWFKQADRNSDGVLTREEFRQDAEAAFKAFDTNADGVISMPEVTRWEEDVAPEISRTPYLGPGQRGRGARAAVGRNELNTAGQGASPYSLINEPHPIRSPDADFSQSVTLAEWRAATERRFTTLDADGDGRVMFGDLKPTAAEGARRR